MARTTQDKVKRTLAQQYNCDNPELGLHIENASGIVDWIESVCDTGHLNSAAQLLKIETALAAHFYGVSEQLLSSKSQGGASGSFQGQTAMYLDSTLFGQMAITMDLSDCLAKKNAEDKTGQKNVVQFGWLGKTPRNQRSAAQRDINGG